MASGNSHNIKDQAFWPESSTLPQPLGTVASDIPNETDSYFTEKAVSVHTSAIIRSSVGSSLTLPGSITPSLFPQPPGQGQVAFEFGASTLETGAPSLRESTYGPTSPSASLFPLPLLTRGNTWSSPRTPSLPPPPPPPKEYPPYGSNKPLPLTVHPQDVQPPSPLLLVSPVSPYAPRGDSRPGPTPLTLQTHHDPNSKALRSPSITFIEPCSPRSHAGSTTALTQLTPAQKDRLWEMKQAHDVRRGPGYASKQDWRRRSSRGSGLYLWAGLGASVLALAGVLGLIVAVSTASKDE
ncbi:hypothetical protein BJ170DRAFT_304408 [Xylariales sp. AK1849]|nr:hypothetical protein BJ170DRAFT_304408 [Xylariales sp. AK1849]